MWWHRAPVTARRGHHSPGAQPGCLRLKCPPNHPQTPKITAEPSNFGWSPAPNHPQQPKFWGKTSPNPQNTPQHAAISLSATASKSQENTTMGWPQHKPCISGGRKCLTPGAVPADLCQMCHLHPAAATQGQSSCPTCTGPRCSPRGCSSPAAHPCFLGSAPREFAGCCCTPAPSQGQAGALGCFAGALRIKGTSGEESLSD